jgi:hypothetical protein
MRSAVAIYASILPLTGFYRRGAEIGNETFGGGQEHARVDACLAAAFAEPFYRTCAAGHQGQ